MTNDQPTDIPIDLAVKVHCWSQKIGITWPPKFDHNELFLEVYKQTFASPIKGREVI